MDRALNDLIKDNEQVIEQQKDSIAIALIRKKYSQNEEFKILRQALAGLDNGEFKEYNDYVEMCKKQAKSFIGEVKETENNEVDNAENINS